MIEEEEKSVTTREGPSIKERVSRFKKGLTDKNKFEHFTSQGSGSLEKLSIIDASILQQFNVFASDFFSITSLATKKLGTEILSARLSPNDTFLLNGQADGTIALQSTGVSKSIQSVTVNPDIPVTAVEWGSRNLFYAGTADGNLRSFSIKSDKDLATSVKNISFEDEKILTLTHSGELQKLLVAGAKREIAVVDENEQKVTSVYKSSIQAEAGHSNRIFCVRFHNENPQLFFSGGWDGIIYFWDLRAAAPVGNIFGPVLAGESLDIKNDILLAGSYRESHNLELYDFRTCKKLIDVPFKAPKGQSVNYISSCKFNRTKDGNELLIAGSCIGDQVVIYRKNITYQGEVYMTGVGKGVFTCGFGNCSNKFYIGTREGHAYVNLLHQS